MTLVKVNNRPFGNLFNDFLNEFPGRCPLVRPGTFCISADKYS